VLLTLGKRLRPYGLDVLPIVPFASVAIPAEPYCSERRRGARRGPAAAPEIG